MSRPRSPRKPDRSPAAPPGERRRGAHWLWLGPLLGVALGFALVALRPGGLHPAPTGSAQPGRAASAPVIEPESALAGQYGGSASCRECHPQAYELWEHSHHALAERPVRADLDAPAFSPTRTFRHGTQATTTQARDGRFEVVTKDLSGQPVPQPVARVIGHDPLRQFLVPAPGGRWQTLEATWDPRSNAWFNVYGNEDRQPGEWGHWTGRGMNWNNMCAGCHNTRLRRNYDATNDLYRTTMVEPAVGCEACHGPLRAHNEWRRAHPNTTERDPTIRPASRWTNLSTCAPCHSRRGDLTGDLRPGDDYFDHHALVVPDESDTYYPDGQVRDENYEFAAFLGSRMNKSGVWCKDCHEPHSAKTILPGNWLCLRCHNGSVTNAPVIDPVKHSFHRVFGYDTNGVPAEVDLQQYDPRRIKETGGECVNCHMPQTVYMQRHWRHDHGFTIPDPLLTQQHGVPNACNRCHADKDAAWALAAVDKWYGAKMDRPSRRRAQTVARARAGDPAARDPLLAQLADPEFPYWQAVAATMLERWVEEPAVAQALIAATRATNALVREKAVRSLDHLVQAGHGPAVAATQARLNDPTRCARVAAGWNLRATLDPASLAGREVEHFLAVNADQPTGQLQLANWALARRQPGAAEEHLRRAVKWDPNSAPLRHELAIVLSQQGRARDAVAELETACKLEPRDAEYRFKLALAYHETGDLPRTIATLEAAVQLDPRHARAWYNLGLARSAAGDPQTALEALIRAESAAPGDAAIPYARATILARLNRIDEARQAARRALELQPGQRDAEELLRSLRAP